MGRDLFRGNEHPTQQSRAAGLSISASSSPSTTNLPGREASPAVGQNTASPWEENQLASYTGPLTSMEALGRWIEIIEIYTGLALTYETDRLIAINGIASCLQSSLKCKYIAGLWDYQLEIQMCWFRGASAMTKRTSVAKSPTWSWISSPGPVRHAIDVPNARMV